MSDMLRRSGRNRHRCRAAKKRSIDTYRRVDMPINRITLASVQVHTVTLTIRRRAIRSAAVTDLFLIT